MDSSKKREWISGGMLLVSILGALDALYLTREHYLGTIPPCSSVSGCETVLTSQYAEIFGVPVALLGLLYYAAIGFCLVFFFATKKTFFLRAVGMATVTGLLASGWFVFVQAFILHAFCLYCLGSAASSTLLFIGGMVLMYTFRKDRHSLAASTHE